ncbi:hypothetical protein ABPG72_020215 [Tetrahymena utriculariae]
MKRVHKNFALASLFIIMVNLAKGQDQVCAIGCLQCDQNFACQQCQVGFTFSEQLNQCVYQQCPLGLFYQLKDNTNFKSSQQAQSGVCQAVCDDNYYQIEQQNICVNFNSCQLSYQSEKDVNQGQIQDVISFNDQYILIIYDQQINLYSRSNGLFQQALPLSQNIIQIIGVNEQVYFLQSNLTFFKWDVSQNNQTIMNTIQVNLSDYQNVYLVKPSNLIICSITQLKSQSQLNIQHLLTIQSEFIPNNPVVIQISYNPLNQVQIFNQFILQIQQNSIRVDEIVVNAKQQMEISYFTAQSFICSNISNLVLSMVQKSLSENYISIIFSQYKILYILQQSECQQLTLEQVPSKILPFMIEDLDYLLIQLPNQISFVKLISHTNEYSQKFNQFIVDMNLSQIQQQKNSFYLQILTNDTYLNVLTIQLINNQIQVIPFNQLQISINQPRKIFFLPQIPKKFFERVFVVGQDLQSFLIEKQNYAFTAEKHEYILENFSLGYDQITSPLVKLVILQKQKTIVACTTDGSLYSWDNGQIYNEIYQNYMQIESSIQVYQLDLTNKIAKLTDKYNSGAQIQIWKVKKDFPQPQYPQFFEVYVFTQDTTFTLLKKTANSFGIFQQVQNLPLAKGLDITFIQNNPIDNYIFILGITNQQTATLPYQCLAINKNSPNFIQFFSVSSAQSLIQPVTFQDSSNNLIYNVKVVQNLSFMSILGTQTFNSADLSNFQDDTTLLYNIQGSKQLLTYDKNFIYAFDQKGFIGLNVFKTTFYSQLYSIPTADFNNGDYINDVKMSYALSRYFIISRSIYIFNINDYTFQEIIQFELNNSSQVNQFIILESEQVVIASKINIIKVKNFITNQTSTFTDSTFTITGIQITPLFNQNMITAYGNRIITLNLNLVNQESVSINFDPLYAIYCQFPPQNIICKLSNNQVVILELKKLIIVQQFTSKNLISSFLIQIDSQQNRLFLYTDSIEVYDLKGIFQSTVTQSSGTIINLNIYRKSLVLVTTSNLVVLDRSSLTNLGTLQGSGGGQILSVFYLEDYNHILVYTNIIRFAQVFVFSLDNLIQITSIKNQYTQNSVTIVADQLFDKYMNIYVFLDQTGSVTFIDYQGIYQQINILKIREFNSGKNPAPVGLRLCPEINILLIYSKNTIYTVNYAQITDSYKRYNLKRGNFYVEINLAYQNQSQNHDEFIFLGMNNGLYFYNQQQLQYLMTIKSKEKILDLNFVSKNLFIVAFQSQILKYDLTSFQKNLNEGIQNINPSTSKRYKFVQFFCSHVFLTLDQKLIHYDFQEDYQLNEIKLNQYQRITSHYLLKTQQILILGFSDGTLIIYNLQDLTLTQLSLILAAGITLYDDVRFIFETESYIWVASLNSQVVCLSKNKLQELSRFNFVQLMQNNTQILGAISIDELNSVIFMNFFKEKIVRCLKLSDQQLVINLSFPDSQYNRILITKTLLIFYSTFQLNIHNRSSLKYLTSIRKQNLQDQIVSVYTFEDKYYFIVSLNKFELFKVDQNNLQITLFDQVDAKSFKLMKVFYNQTSQFLRVIGVSNNQVFDQQYSMIFYELQKSFNQTQCSINIKDQNFIQMQNSIDLIIPLKIQQPNHLSLQEQFNSASNTFMTIYLNQQNLNEVNIQANSDSQITLVPSQGTLPFYITQNKTITQPDILQVQENTFVNFPKQYLIIKNFNLLFKSHKQLINQNQATKKTYLQNISISNQNLHDIQIQISNNDIVVIMNLILENLTINYSSQGVSFLSFFSCQQIYIYNLILRDVQITGINNSLINITNSNIIQINSTQISHSKLSQFLYTANTQNVLIQNVSVVNSSSQIDSNEDTNFLFNIFGGLNLHVSQIVMQQNTNLKFILTKNQIQKQLQIITLLSDQVTMIQAQFQQNIFNSSKQQPLIKFYSTNITIDQFKFSQNQGNIQLINSQNVEINNSNFLNNTNQDGGALSFINNFNLIIIKNSLFQFNEAFASGGAIYCQEFTGHFVIDDSTAIIYNKALIGGGIRIYNVINDMRDQEMKSLFQNLNVKNNSAQFYGQQFTTFLQKIEISQIFSDSNSTFQELPYSFLTQNQLSLEEQASYSGKLQIQNLRSGSLLQIQLFGMDSNSDFIKFSQDLVKNGNYPNSIQQELLQYYFKIENADKSQILLNGETLITSDQYNQTNYQFIFKEVQITSFPLKNTQMLINYQINNKQTLPILVQIQYRNCLVGEAVKVLSPNIISCTLCPSGSYLLSAPQISQNSSSNQYIEENSQCQKCPDSAEQCQGSEIILKDGYWRNNINSSEIIYCENNPNNCQSKNNKSMNGCVLGSIGPLCEECDTQGIVWKNKQFTRSFQEDYTCVECNTMKHQTIFIILYSLVLIIYSLLNTIIFMQSFKFTQACYYLRSLSLFPISKSSIRDQSNSYLKILNNYLQIVSYLIYFRVQLLPQFISNCIDLVQSPVQKFAVSIDCIISSVFKDRIERIHATQIIYLCIPLGFILFLSTLIRITERIMKINVQITHIYTLLNFLFVFFQPSQIMFFTKSLSCRSIGSNSYQVVDLLISCSDSSYLDFSIPFSICVLIFWILVPLVIFFKLKKQKEKLNFSLVRYKYGFYYSEFKPQFYYWEFIRLNIRILVIMIFNLIPQNVYLVYLLIIFIFGLYIKSVLLFNPIQNKQLQRFEILSNQLIIFNLILISVIITFPSYTLQLLIYIEHLIFIFYIILIIVAQKAMSKLNFFGKIFWYILQKILTKNTYQKFEQRNTIQFKTFKRWMLIKKNIYQIIAINALQNAEKAIFSQSNSSKNKGDDIVNINMHEVNNSKTGFYSQTQDEILQCNQKSFLSVINQNSPEIRADCFMWTNDETQNQLRNNQNQNQEYSSIFESKFSNISEKVRIDESSDLQDQEKLSQTKKHVLPGQYNIQLQTIQQLNNKNKSKQQSKGNQN